MRQGPHHVAQKSIKTWWPLKESRRTVFPERSLSSKLGAATTWLRRPLQAEISPIVAATAKTDLALPDQQRIQALLDFRFWMDADKLVNHFSILKE